MTPPPRIVTLVLVDAAGTVLGALPPFEAATPWWMDIAPVVRAVRERQGLRVVVLRLLEAERDAPHGGAVSYLAELVPGQRVPPLRPWPGRLQPDPQRRAYAEIGGPQADLAWAASVLAARGDAPAGEPQQIRTWNLSSLWRVPTRSGSAWLKVVPPFFAHEGAMLEALADAPVPRLLGRDGARVLLAHIDGEDRVDPPLADALAMVDLLVQLQSAWAGRAGELLALGLPDWRADAYAQALAALLARRAGELDAAARASLAAFAGTLPARFAEVAACGLPDGLVHGDFHPQNLRGQGDAMTLLDWGDCGVGHPLLDQPAFLDRMPAGALDAVRAHWAAAWQRRCPGADVARAARLLAPVAAGRQALIYQRFLDGIEASEQVYHREDVLPWLRRAAALLAAEPGA